MGREAGWLRGDGCTQGEVERLNNQLRAINNQLRQQARAGTAYAPGLTYAPASVSLGAPPMAPPPPAARDPEARLQKEIATGISSVPDTEQPVSKEAEMVSRCAPQPDAAITLTSDDSAELCWLASPAARRAGGWGLDCLYQMANGMCTWALVHTAPHLANHPPRGLRQVPHRPSNASAES